jgi:hypothetical protein
LKYWVYNACKAALVLDKTHCGILRRLFAKEALKVVG